MTITIGPPTPVEINQLAEEFELALDLYRETAPARVLEIGTAAGGTLYHWLQNAAAPRFGKRIDVTRVVSVDLDMSQIDEDTVANWGAKFASCILIQGDSTTPWTKAKIHEHGPFDWVFIDGCHEYEIARKDFDAYVAMCNPGAYVLLHDIALQRNYGEGRTAGVHQLWRELQAAGHWTREIRAAPNLTEYGIGVIAL